MHTPLRRRRHGLVRRFSWLAVASLMATALLAAPTIALGHTSNVAPIPVTAVLATDAAPVESQGSLGDNWRLIALAVVGAIAVTLRRTTAPAKPTSEPTDN